MKIVSHYTNDRGIFGIIRSQSLRATDFLSLNDKVEFVYALSEIVNKALAMSVSQVPEDMLKKDVESELSKLTINLLKDNIRTQIKNSDGYGGLYVTSFACGKTEDEDERGILTLWDRYTKNEGYCIQFDLENIARIVDFERERNSYALIKVSEIIYGVDENSEEFNWLVEQYCYRLLIFASKSRPDLNLNIDMSRVAVEGVFLLRLLDFCGRHKDPAFSDEREVRILAYPENHNQNRALIGIAFKKKIHQYDNLSSKKYIIIGENRAPGIIPNRILTGPKNNTSLQIIYDLYPPCPLIRKSDIPVA